MRSLSEQDVGLFRWSAALAVLATTAALLLGGCRTPVSDDYLRWVGLPFNDLDSGTLGEGDRLAIRVYQEPEMSGEFRVPRSGTIQFPLIGEVQILDRACPSIEIEIRDRLAQGYLRQPSVSCQVLEVRSRTVVVSGEVSSPGVYTFAPNMSVVEAIALAQGLTRNAVHDRVVITRTVEGERHEIVVPYQQILSGQAPNLPLWPSDSIFVPTFRLIP